MLKMDLSQVTRNIAEVSLARPVGHVSEIFQDKIRITGLSQFARTGDILTVGLGESALRAEVVQIGKKDLVAMVDGITDRIQMNDSVAYDGVARLHPSDHWKGRIIDPFGAPMDGKHLMCGVNPINVRAAPPDASKRRPLGPRLETGLAAFNTFLPIVTGQRVGLFAGSGVGKSTLLGMMCQGIQADTIVIGLVGERGRELMEFVTNVLGQEGLARSVVVAATSDQAPQTRRRCAWTAMAVAEYFRDQGQNVLLLLDSVTRFAEAHREVAVAGGEDASLRGFPASTNHMITALCERAGPGLEGKGDITAVFSVLVAGSDMEEPIADMMRGVLDGHIVLDREIAERGRFPAIDLQRSVSRALPEAATAEQNKLLLAARKLLATYTRSEMMIQAGLYVSGSDPDIDASILAYPEIDNFLTLSGQDITTDFARLGRAVRAGQKSPMMGKSSLLSVDQQAGNKFEV